MGQFEDKRAVVDQLLLWQNFGCLSASLLWFLTWYYSQQNGAHFDKS